MKHAKGNGFFNRFIFPALLLATVLLFAGCRSEMGVRQVGWRQNRLIHNNNPLSGQLSTNTANFLAASQQLNSFSSNPDEIIADLDQFFHQTRERRYLEMLADLCFYKAEHESNPDVAIRYYMSCAYYSYLYLFGHNLYPEEVSALQPEAFRQTRFYNASACAVFEYLQDQELLFKSSFQLPSVTTGSVIVLPLINALSIESDQLDRMPAAADFEVENALTFSYRYGVGVPLVAKLRDDSKILDDRIFFNQTFPATFFLRFQRSGEQLQVTPELHDPLREKTVSVNDTTAPLEYDLTTPLAYFLQRPSILGNLAYMLNPASNETLEGLYTLTPYDQDKIPVVLVHGLMSNPRTWAQMLNSLMNDPRIRDNFQFWMYTYSTGNPILYSAHNFRNRLIERHQELNPDGDHPNLDQMVIIAHSMGGLLAKTALQDGAETTLAQAFEFDPAEISEELSEEESAFMKEIFYFKHLPFVNRVVFLAVPHRGSDLATFLLVKWSTRLITLPQNVVAESHALIEAIKMHNAFPERNFTLPTGLDGLDPTDRSLQYLNTLPFSPEVPYHSIIGNQKAAGIPGGSDGIVPYSSAHLDGVASELVVKSGHSVQESTATIEEIRRILLEHLVRHGRLTRHQASDSPLDLNSAARPEEKP